MPFSSIAPLEALKVNWHKKASHSPEFLFSTQKTGGSSFEVHFFLV